MNHKCSPNRTAAEETSKPHRNATLIYRNSSVRSAQGQTCAGAVCNISPHVFNGINSSSLVVSCPTPLSFPRTVDLNCLLYFTTSYANRYTRLRTHSNFTFHDATALLLRCWLVAFNVFFTLIDLHDTRLSFASHYQNNFQDQQG